MDIVNKNGKIIIKIKFLDSIIILANLYNLI